MFPDKEAKINDLEMQLFFLEMKDHWDSVDYDEAQRLRDEIKKLKEDK